MGHDHTRAVPAQSASGRHRNRLTAALAIGVAYLLAEIVVVVTTRSLAVLADAAHMVTDVVGLWLALAAILLAQRARPTAERTFGYYRAEVLAALANAVLLFAVAMYVLVEAVSRVDEPPHVPGLPVLIVGAIGLVTNTAAFVLLRAGAAESLNLRGAYLEVVSDLVGSCGVLLSAAITLLTHWPYADMVLGVAIGLWVLPRSWVLARRSLRILFQHSPEGLDVDRVAAALRAVPGVTDVHDLHVWTLTSGMEVASAHLATEPDHDRDQVLRTAQKLLALDFHISHATLQIERADSAGPCGEISW